MKTLLLLPFLFLLSSCWKPLFPQPHCPPPPPHCPGPTTIVPEPSTITLLGAGLVAVALLRRKK